MYPLTQVNLDLCNGLLPLLVPDEGQQGSLRGTAIAMWKKMAKVSVWCIDFLSAQ